MQKTSTHPHTHHSLSTSLNALLCIIPKAKHTYAHTVPPNTPPPLPYEPCDVTGQAAPVPPLLHASGPCSRVCPTPPHSSNLVLFAQLPVFPVHPPPPFSRPISLSPLLRKGTKMKKKPQSMCTQKKYRDTVRTPLLGELSSLVPVVSPLSLLTHTSVPHSHLDKATRADTHADTHQQPLQWWANGTRTLTSC